VYLDWEAAVVNGPSCWEIAELPASCGEIGAKAASLRLLDRSGFRVPPGFVVGNAHFFALARGAGVASKLELLEKTLWSLAPKHIEKLAGEIRTGLSQTPVSDHLLADLSRMRDRLGLEQGPLVCRSSSSFEDSDRWSFPGVFTTRFDIHDLEGVKEAIVACYTSLVAPLALNYRRTVRPESTRFAMAVIVQRQIDADVSGVVFSREPCGSTKSDAVFIEAVAGRGDALVWGDVAPHQYRVPSQGPPQVAHVPGNPARTDDSPHRMARSQFDDHAMLNDTRLELVGNACRLLRSEIGREVDAEFAFAGDDRQPYWLQVRPVTDHPAPRVSVAARDVEVARSHRGIVCSTGTAIGFGFDIRAVAATVDELSDKIVLADSLTLDDYDVLCCCLGVVSEDYPSKLNHVSIACREIGLPFLGGIEAARQLHGVALRLDGAAGTLCELASTTDIGSESRRQVTESRYSDMRPEAFVRLTP
jgi:pyruvate,water dikinase